MVMSIIKRSFAVIGKKPWLLWGLSLLFVLLCGLACALGVLPIISLPIVLVLEFGMTSIFLAAVRAQEYSTEQLFCGFKDFKRVACGMGWMYLWVFLWGLIPVAGVVFAVIKIYTYRFVPYILLTHPEVTPTQAIKISIDQTKGYRGKMFGADMLILAGIVVTEGVLFGLSQIPYAGYLFAVILAATYLVLCAITPLIYGLIAANFYNDVDMIANRPRRCMSCGQELQDNAVFCPVCGTRQQ